MQPRYQLVGTRRVRLDTGVLDRLDPLLESRHAISIVEGDARIQLLDHDRYKIAGRAMRSAIHELPQVQD